MCGTRAAANRTTAAGATTQSGPPFTVGFGGSPYNYLPGAARPNLVPGVDPITPNWTIGKDRFPTQAQVPYLNAAAFAYPAAFRSEEHTSELQSR